MHELQLPANGIDLPITLVQMKREKPFFFVQCIQAARARFFPRQNHNVCRLHTFLSCRCKQTAGTGFHVKWLTQSLCQCMDDDDYDVDGQQQQPANCNSTTAFRTHLLRHKQLHLRFQLITWSSIVSAVVCQPCKCVGLWLAQNHNAYNEQYGCKTVRSLAVRRTTKHLPVHTSCAFKANDLSHALLWLANYLNAG